ncbi:serine/threonine-protein kinase [Agromyces sp. NPDC057865]|uniref:serine/threonine-protein kinase n=1 Tax=Agromyces sp. NPDC057865 TaxID=3346267 RepID=UPI00367054D5
MSSTPGTLVAERYRLVKLLGTGGMGIVWEAWDVRLERAVALKMLRTQPYLSPEEREMATNRAMREARITAGLHHPHAVTVFDVVEHEGEPCIVMQLIHSTPSSVLLREHGTFTPGQTARMGAQVASALAAAHRLRIVHRDVKPGNILITEDGSAMISDFGISHALGDATITATGMMHGTPAYLAPEVARGRPSGFASDVYSLGSTLYAMLEGAPPFGVDDNAIALLHRVARGSFTTPKRAGVLAPLLREMLTADPKKRPDMPSVAERLAELQQRIEASESPAATLVLPAAAAPVTPPAEPPTPTTTGDTRRVGDTAETERLAILQAEPTAETDRLGAATASTSVPTARIDEPTAETERLGAATAATTVPTARLDEPNVEAELPAQRATPSLSWLVQGPPVEPSDAPPVHASRPPRRSRTAAVIGGLIVVAILAIGGVLLFNTLRPGADEAGGPETGGAPVTTRPTPSETPTIAAEPPSPTSTPPPVAEPDGTQAPPPAPTPEQRLTSAVTDYYALMPGNLDAAWPLMTADYQENHVGGRVAYDDFWGDVASISIADVVATAPDRAQATLTYTYNDGSVVQEVTAYRFVDESGVLKVAETDVLSSVTL